jgi:putative ABC transport system ATP-binding protein/macrolide transport system ATP-binding/permease protein/lipoprotein-releasing system ATP-binding protein
MPVAPRQIGDVVAPVTSSPVEATPLGSGLGQFMLDFAGWIVAASVGVGLVNYGAGLWQHRELASREEMRRTIEEVALQKLRADVEDVVPEADGSFRLSIYVQNQGPGTPIYVMGPALRAFVQVGGAWQAVPLTAVDRDANEVRRIEDKVVFAFILRADLRQFDELLKGYMHVRITNSMIIAAKGQPGDDLFERTDDYYFYLRSPHYSDDEVRQANHWKAGGIVPRWIPMPAH